jgi:hypothetical protein
MGWGHGRAPSRCDIRFLLLKDQSPRAGLSGWVAGDMSLFPICDRDCKSPGFMGLKEESGVFCLARH